MMKRCQSDMARMLALGWLMGISLFFCFGQVAAQSLRDPTLPPIESGQAGTTAAGPSWNSEAGALTIIVRDGRPYLAVGMRLYAQGEKLGKSRIERISESEVWFLEAGVLHKVSKFHGIQRRTVTPVAVKPACAASSKTSSPVAPCAAVQP